MAVAMVNKDITAKVHTFKYVKHTMEAIKRKTTVTRTAGRQWDELLVLEVV